MNNINEVNGFNYGTNISPIVTTPSIGDIYTGYANETMSYDYGQPVYQNYLGRTMNDGGLLNEAKTALTTGMREANMLGGVAKDTVGDVVDKVGAGVGAMSFGQKAMAVGGLAKGVFDAYNAYKANKLAKEQFAFTKMNTNRNFQAQANVTNSQLADRQAARVARDPNHFTSVSDYMSKYGVKV